MNHLANNDLDKFFVQSMIWQFFEIPFSFIINEIYQWDNLMNAMILYHRDSRFWTWYSLWETGALIWCLLSLGVAAYWTHLQAAASPLDTVIFEKKCPTSLVTNPYTTALLPSYQAIYWSYRRLRPEPCFPPFGTYIIRTRGTTHLLLLLLYSQNRHRLFILLISCSE